jgi:hypothetical protein
VPLNNTYIEYILCHIKFGKENSIYDMKWGTPTLGTFSPFVFTSRSLDFGFLRWRLKRRFSRIDITMALRGSPTNGLNGPVTNLANDDD